MNALTALVITLVPSLLLGVGVISSRRANQNPGKMADLAGGAAWAAVAVALLAVALSVRTGVVQAGFGLFSLYFDALSATLLVLVAFIGAVVIRYSRNYLKGDPEQGRFLKWLCLTCGSVLTLVVSGNLVLFTLAWMATSMSLHQLLVFYRDRPAAIAAARKKFVVSRLGDLCLMMAMLLIYRAFGSLQFGQIFDVAGALHLAGVDEALHYGGPSVPWIAFLLVLGALLKSAQFPFHSWLPEVMEAPTPVSALLHAGIINAGGFLIVRMSPLLALAPSALDVLAVLGAATALFGSVAMLTQTSIKKSLAYSTVGQMGFMMLQCGLGAFSSAILHIVAHALYKAHAFLSSGSIVDIARASWLPAGRREHPGRATLLAALAVAVALTFGLGMAFGFTPATAPGVLVLGATTQIALAFLIWNSLDDTRALAFRGIALALAAGVVYFLLQRLFAAWLAPALPLADIPRGDFDLLLMAGVIGLFMAILVLQTRFPDRESGRLWQAAYVHFHNGLYVGALANRVLRRQRSANDKI